jgi:hypothetical protein
MSCHDPHGSAHSSLPTLPCPALPCPALPCHCCYSCICCLAFHSITVPALTYHPSAPRLRPRPCSRSAIPCWRCRCLTAPKGDTPGTSVPRCLLHCGEACCCRLFRRRNYARARAHAHVRRQPSQTRIGQRCHFGSLVCAPPLSSLSQVTSSCARPVSRPCTSLPAASRLCLATRASACAG